MGATVCGLTPAEIHALRTAATGNPAPANHATRLEDEGLTDRGRITPAGYARLGRINSVQAV